MDRLWIIISVLYASAWESVGITNKGRPPPREGNFRNFRHVASPSAPISTDWEVGLREAVNQALLREGYHDYNLRDRLLEAPLIGRRDIATPFGDIVILARGQLYVTEGGHFLFVQDQYQNDCDACHNPRPRCVSTPCQIWQPDENENLIALWTVKRLRHRNYNGGHYYELEYIVSPITSTISEYVTRNGRFDYGIPGHIFVVKNDKVPHNRPDSHFVNNKRLPNDHYKPEILIGVNANGEKHILHSYPGFYTSFPVHPTYHQHKYSTNDPKEIELYKELIEALAAKTSSTQKVETGPHKFSLNGYTESNTDKVLFTKPTYNFFPVTQSSTTELPSKHLPGSTTSTVTNTPIHTSVEVSQTTYQHSTVTKPSSISTISTKPTMLHTDDIFSNIDTMHPKNDQSTAVTQPVTTTIHFFTPIGEEDFLMDDITDMKKITLETITTKKPILKEKPTESSLDFLFPQTEKSMVSSTASTTKYHKPTTITQDVTNILEEPASSSTETTKQYQTNVSETKPITVSTTVSTTSKSTTTETMKSTIPKTTESTTKLTTLVTPKSTTLVTPKSTTTASSTAKTTGSSTSRTTSTTSKIPTSTTTKITTLSTTSKITIPSTTRLKPLSTTKTALAKINTTKLKISTSTQKPKTSTLKSKSITPENITTKDSTNTITLEMTTIPTTTTNKMATFKFRTAKTKQSNLTGFLGSTSMTIPNKVTTYKPKFTKVRLPKLMTTKLTTTTFDTSRTSTITTQSLPSLRTIQQLPTTFKSTQQQRPTVDLDYSFLEDILPTKPMLTTSIQPKETEPSLTSTTSSYPAVVTTTARGNIETENNKQTTFIPSTNTLTTITYPPITIKEVSEFSTESIPETTKDEENPTTENFTSQKVEGTTSSATKMMFLDNDNTENPFTTQENNEVRESIITTTFKPTTLSIILGLSSENTEPITSVSPRTTLSTTTRKISKTTSQSTTIVDDFLTGNKSDRDPTYTKTMKTDFNEDDIFGGAKIEAKPTKPSATKEITESNLADELFGSRESKSVETDTAPLKGTKIIYSNFFEASTAPVPQSTEYTTERETDETTMMNLKPSTSQSFATSISFKVKQKDENITKHSNAENSINTTTDDIIGESGKTTELKTTEASNLNKTDTKKSFDHLALQLINHAKSINYLNSSNNKTNRGKYKRRKTYIPKNRRGNSRKQFS